MKKDFIDSIGEKKMPVELAHVFDNENRNQKNQKQSNQTKKTLIFLIRVDDVISATIYQITVVTIVMYMQMVIM